MRDGGNHHLGGVAAAIAGVEVRTVPEAPGRFTADTLPVERADPPAAVDVGLYSDGVSGRAFLEPAQARALADRLATAAAAVEQHDTDE